MDVSLMVITVMLCTYVYCQCCVLAVLSVKAFSCLVTSYNLLCPFSIGSIQCIQPPICIEGFS